MASLGDLEREWLETDGLGGFASGTVGTIRTRRYHGILTAALSPPGDRHVLVAGLEWGIVSDGQRIELSSQRYAPDVLHPEGFRRLVTFENDPWPTWTYSLGEARVVHEILMLSGAPITVVRFRYEGAPGAHLELRPLLAMRPFHSLQKEHAVRFDPVFRLGRVSFSPLCIGFDGTYRHEPSWYRNFLYVRERERGLDSEEDLASPGTFHHDFDDGDAEFLFARECETSERVLGNRSTRALVREIRDRESHRRASFANPLARSADQFFVRRGDRKTVIAGYPWFGDWGRDTFIALRGLALANDRFDDARDILLEWAGRVDQGMLPNRFSEANDQPEFNSVDASLWFVVAAGELLERDRGRLSPNEHHVLTDAILAIVDGYSRGTRHGILRDTDDDLLRAGAPGLQLTWMDAKVGDWVVTPRSGKPVEIQALWINALAIAGRFFERWQAVATRARASFQHRFWDDSRGCLFDVVDVDHESGRIDTSFRPNQIFAVGGLPLVLLDDQRARRVVDAVEQRLLTPLGLRSLARDEAGYRRQYAGGPPERDGAYHQGTVWPWLLGPFVEAWLRVRGDTEDARREARERFMPPLEAHLGEAGLGHVSEIADAEAPYSPRGCPFQAWSLSELLRILQMIGAQGQKMSSSGQ